MEDQLKDIITDVLPITTIKVGEVVIDISDKEGKELTEYLKEYKCITVPPTLESLQAVILGIGKKQAKLIIYIGDLDLLGLDVGDFITKVTELLAEDGIWVMQQRHELGETELDHNGYHSLDSLEPLMKKANLEIFHVALNEDQGGSFRVYIRFKKDLPENFTVLSMRQAEAEYAKVQAQLLKEYEYEDPKTN